VLGDEIEDFTSAQNSILYFDNEHDDKARRVRELYFSVAPPDARKELIRKVLELDDLYDRSSREDVTKAKRALWSAKENEESLPWSTAAVMGVVCVLIGYWIGNTIGAIAGAVAGIFFGMGTVSNARRDRKAAVARAVEEVESSEKALHEMLSRPRFFTVREANTGIRDETYYVDAFGARIREFKSSNAS